MVAGLLLWDRPVSMWPSHDKGVRYRACQPVLICSSPLFFFWMDREGSRYNRWLLHCPPDGPSLKGPVLPLSWLWPVRHRPQGQLWPGQLSVKFLCPTLP